MKVATGIGPHPIPWPYFTDPQNIQRKINMQMSTQFQAQAQNQRRGINDSSSNALPSNGQCS